MKNSNIALLFRKHEAKAKKVAGSSPPVPPVPVVEEELCPFPIEVEGIYS